MATQSFDILRELGEQVRTWRQQTGRVQQVAGFRLERRFDYMTQDDLAEACGVSITLIQRLEAGRYPHVTDELLHRIGQGLRLTHEQLHYLMLFRSGPLPGATVLTTAATRPVQQTVDRLLPVPALVANQVFDIIYWNVTAIEMIAPFHLMPSDQRNVVLSMFLDPEMRVRWAAWERNARSLVAGLKMTRAMNRHLAGHIDRIVERIARGDQQFREWWATEEPRMAPPFDKRYTHPRYGPLNLSQCVQDIVGDVPQTVIFFQARDPVTSEAFAAMWRDSQGEPPAERAG